MASTPTEVNSFEDLQEITDALILYTLGHSNYPVIQCEFIVAVGLEVKSVSDFITERLADSAVADERYISSNVGQDGKHFGRRFVVTMTKFT